MKNLYLLVVGIFLLTSCSSNDDLDSASKKLMTFSITGNFINPEFSRASQSMTADGVEMTDLWVVDVVDGEIKQTLHQTSADADWGAPKMSLTLGTHHVMFLASRGQGAQYADGVVTWQKPLDTFYLDYEVAVSKTSNGNRAVTLSRCATRLQVVASDAIPSRTTAITLTPGKWYNGWNMISGLPVEAADYSVTFVITSSQWNRTGLAISAWGLSPSDEWTTDISITSFAGDQPNASATIMGAPLTANRTTRYSGNLYTATAESSVSLSAEWLPQYEGIY